MAAHTLLGRMASHVMLLCSIQPGRLSASLLEAHGGVHWSSSSWIKASTMHGLAGIMANFLVCLAVWLASSARDFTGKVWHAIPSRLAV